MLTLPRIGASHHRCALATLPPARETCSTEVVMMYFRTRLAEPRRRLDLAHVARLVSPLTVAACGAALLVAGPVIAAPSIDGDNQPVVSSGLLTTPVVEGRNWTAAASLNTVFDSNYRRAPVPESALRLSPALILGAGLPLGRQQLFVGANFGRDFTLGHPEFNRNRSGIGGGIAWRVGARCSGLIGGEHQNRLNQVFEQVEFTPNVQKINVVAASARCQSSTGFGVGGSVRHEDIENDRLQRQAFNLRSTVYAPNISYGTPTIGQFSLGATFNDTTYSGRLVPTPVGFQLDGIKMFSGRVGYSRALGSRLRLSLGASYLKTTPRPATQLSFDPNGLVIEVQRSTFSGSGYDGSIGYQASPRLRFDISGSRNVRVSPNVGASFIVTQAFSADMAYRLGSKLEFGIGANRLQNDYKNSFVSPDEPVLRVSDRTHRIHAQLDYAPVALYSVGFVVSHQWRESNPAIFDFKSTTASLRLRVKFGRV